MGLKINQNQNAAASQVGAQQKAAEVGTTKEAGQGLSVAEKKAAEVKFQAKVEKTSGATLEALDLEGAIAQNTTAPASKKAAMATNPNE